MNKLIVIFVLLNELNIFYQLECSEYDDDSCGGHNSEYILKCHRFQSNGCQEIEVDKGCQINSLHQCTVETNVTLPDDEICISYGANKCRRIKDICTSYSDNCETHSGNNAAKICVKLSDSNHCSEVDIKETCKIQNGACVDDTGIAAGKKCDFNNEKTICEPRDKLCSDQELTTCEQFTTTNGLTCSNIGEAVCKLVDIKETCKIQNGACVDDTGIAAGKKCDFKNEKTICEPRDKLCNELDENPCGNIAEENKFQCYKFEEKQKCIQVTIDEYCYINSSGNCVEKREGILTDNEICKYIDGKTKCLKKEKLCSDLADDICESYTPITKLCFNFEGVCKEVKVDESCQMNSLNECIAKKSLGKHEVCTLNDDKNKCYKKKTGEASLLSLKLFSIFLLFLIN